MISEQEEELLAQKEELTAAIEELLLKNKYLDDALQQLTVRNKELDILLYRASHDLKTPVSSLEGLINLLEAENLTESQRELTYYMEDKVSQMRDVIKSISMLSEASFNEVRFNPLDVRELAYRIKDGLRYLPNFANVDVEFQFDGVVSINTDDLLFHNILKSLLANAITFRDSLTHGSVKVLFECKKSLFITTVQDDGEGIANSIQDRVFDMFFRGSERSIGSGLGLYIAKKAVDRLKGSIAFESQPGRTIFKVFLPIASQAKN